MTTAQPIEDLLRESAPQVLTALLRRHRHLDLCEDAVQEALLAASIQWPESGVPQSPSGWLVTVASRRLIDRVRSDAARRRREQDVLVGSPPSELLAALPNADADDVRDDTVKLLSLCCHPALTPASQLALTLRAVGGLTTAEIATAFLVPEATIAQRISRAKQTIRDAGASFDEPATDDERVERLHVVMHVLYLIFNEGYTATSGSDIHRTDLSKEAIRLAREVHRLLPDDGEAAGLLALMLLTDARRPARTTPSGELVPLAEQDRSLWNTACIDEGVALVTTALARQDLGPYQVQAAIAAVHDEAATEADTDWAQIVALYDVLDRIAPNPMATLSRAVAVGEMSGADVGLDLLRSLEDDPRLTDHHRLYAVRGHFLEQLDRADEAAAAYRQAARRTASLPQRRYLEGRAATLTGSTAPANPVTRDP